MCDSSHAVCARAPGGCRLQDVVHGSMKWVLASNFMVDMTWLLSACPHLLQAHQLVIVHGERTPDRHETFTCKCYNTCSLTQCSTVCMQRDDLAGSTDRHCRDHGFSSSSWRKTDTQGWSVCANPWLTLWSVGSLSAAPSCSIQHDPTAVCQLMLKSTATSHACHNVCKCPCSCRGDVACLTSESTLNSENSICLQYPSLPCELDVHAVAQCPSTVPTPRQQHEQGMQGGGHESCGSLCWPCQSGGACPTAACAVWHLPQQGLHD